MRQMKNGSEEVQIEINLAAYYAKMNTDFTLIFNLLFGIGLQYLFEIFRALQIIIMLPLFRSSIPANAGMVFNVLTQIAAYDVFEIGDYVNDTLELFHTDPVNEKFESIGLETLYFINNLGSFFLVVMFDLLVCLLILITQFLIWLSPKKCLQKVHQKLNKKMFFNDWIVTV